MMQIVIDIDEDTYRYMQSRCKYQNKGDKGLSKFEKAGVAIKNGAPLPKGHGRLIDADAAKCSSCGKFGCENSDLCELFKAKTIIEADGGDTE